MSLIFQEGSCFINSSNNDVNLVLSILGSPRVFSKIKGFAQREFLPKISILHFLKSFGTPTLMKTKRIQGSKLIASYA